MITFLYDKNKSIILQMLTLKKKNKSIKLRSFARKTKVSFNFYITQLEEQNPQSIPNNSWQEDILRSLFSK